MPMPGEPMPELPIDMPMPEEPMPSMPPMPLDMPTLKLPLL